MLSSISQFGIYFSWVGLICGLFFFVYSVRYYLESILVLLRDQKELREIFNDRNQLSSLGFKITPVGNLSYKGKGNYRTAKVMGFKTRRIKNELHNREITKTELGFVSSKVNLVTGGKMENLIKRMREMFWEIRDKGDFIEVYSSRLGLRKRLHTALIIIIKKSSYDDVVRTGLTFWRALIGKKLNPAKELKYHFDIDRRTLGWRDKVVGSTRKLKRKNLQLVNQNNIGIIDDPDLQPFVSIHLPFYNEQDVAVRSIEAALAQDYKNYEIVIADDSNDDTPAIIAHYEQNRKIKIVRRDNRVGFKGGALKAAIAKTSRKSKFILVFDADFVPPPNTIKMFLKEFYEQNGHTLSLDRSKNLAALQGYQWHVLNKDENFVTHGVRFGFSGGYMVERVAQQYFGTMKMIAGSVFMIRRDVMDEFTWQNEEGYTSIVEDWNLTIRLYLAGWKIGYTPKIKVPAECVNSLNKLIKQQVRWAEGHTWNVKKYFWRVMLSNRMRLREKLEFLYYTPFYLQSLLFIIGTIGWLVGEIIFQAKIPGWTATLGWSLVFTNLLALPIMCVAGIVLERGESKDYNILPFLTFVYYVIPAMAWASLRGLVLPYEGGWIRTQKTGHVTDAIMESEMAGEKKQLINRNIDLLKKGLAETSQAYNKAQPLFKYATKQTEGFRDGRLWLELKRVPRMGAFIIAFMALGLGLLSYVGSQQTTQASPDLLYLTHVNNSYGSFDYVMGSNEKSKPIRESRPSFSWYSDICPSGDSPGGIAAGSYSTTLYFTRLPRNNTSVTIQASVGHVDESGRDYQSIVTSGTYTVTPSSPTSVTGPIGNGLAVECTPENPRRLVYTINYVSGDGRVRIGYNSASNPSSITTPAIVVPEFGLILGGPMALAWYLVKKKKIKIKRK